VKQIFKLKLNLIGNNDIEFHHYIYFKLKQKVLEIK